MTDDRMPFDFLAYLRERGPALRRMIRPKVGPRGGELDDVMQETLSRLWQHRERIATFADADAFCRVTAHRIATDNARRAIPLPLPAPDSLPGTSPDPAQQVEDRAFVAVVRDVLPPRQAAVLLGALVEGQSTSDLARRLGTTNRAVAALKHRAWQRLIEERHRFASLVGCLAAAAVPRRRALSSARASVGCCGVVTVAVGIGLLVATPYLLDTEGADGTPSVAAASAPAPQPLDAATWHVRDVSRLDGSLRRSGTDEDEGAPRNRKVNGCLPGAFILCAGSRDGAGMPGHGHGIWIDPPVLPAQEVRTDAAPVCDYADALPESDLTGCERYGAARRGSPITGPVPAPGGTAA